MHISLPTRFETSQGEVCLILSTQSLEDLLPAPVAEGLILSLWTCAETACSQAISYLAKLSVLFEYWLMWTFQRRLASNTSENNLIFHFKQTTFKEICWSISCLNHSLSQTSFTCTSYKVSHYLCGKVRTFNLDMSRLLV